MEECPPTASTIENHTRDSAAVSIFTVGNTLVSVSENGTVHDWDLVKTMRLSSCSIAGTSKPLARSHDGRIIASLDRCSKVCRIDAPESVATFEIMADIERVRLSPDGALVAYASRDCRAIKIWRSAPSVVMSELEVSENIGDMTFSPDNQVLAISSERKQWMVTIWDIEDCKKVETIVLNNDPGRLHFSSSRPLLFSSIHGQLPMQTILSYKGPINQKPGSRQSPFQVTPGGDWINWRTKSLLWLPFEYRPTSGNAWDAMGDSVIIGHAAGRLTFMKFDEHLLE